LSDQLHAPAALPPGKTPLNGLGGPSTGLGTIFFISLEEEVKFQNT